MAKRTRVRFGITSRKCQGGPNPSASDLNKNKSSKKSEKNYWNGAICSVCMEHPHKAVLLLCSSHDKGCRPYMCGTSCRYSNCLKQYKKAYAKVTFPEQSHSLHGSTSSTAAIAPFSAGECKITELACPLCRGQVKGWTVVGAAREYLNAKKRTCTHDNCSFSGNYKEMRKHVKADHPSARPHEVNPLLEEKWRQFEQERERDDVISTVTSATGGGVVFGDYVIGGQYVTDSEDEDGFEGDTVEQNEDSRVGVNGGWMRFLMFLQAFGSVSDIHSDRDI